MNQKNIGDMAILNSRKIGLFCSHKARPDAILKTLDLAREWRDAGKTVISG